MARFAPSHDLRLPRLSRNCALASCSSLSQRVAAFSRSGLVPIFSCFFSILSAASGAARMYFLSRSSGLFHSVVSVHFLVWMRCGAVRAAAEPSHVAGPFRRPFLFCRHILLDEMRFRVPIRWSWRAFGDPVVLHSGVARLGCFGSPCFFSEVHSVSAGAEHVNSTSIYGDSY